MKNGLSRLKVRLTCLAAICIGTLFIGSCVSGQRSVYVDQNNSLLFGFIDKTGAFRITPRFQETKPFSDGLAAARKGNKWGYIDKSGEFIIKPRFDVSADDFKSGLAYVTWTEKGDGVLTGSPERNALIDKTGKVVVERARNTFSGGMTLFYGDDQKCGFVDSSGKVMVKPEFEDADDFSDNLAPVKIDGKYGYINTDGNFVIPPKFTHAGRFSSGLAAAAEGDKCGYIDKHGKFVIPPKFELPCQAFEGGLASVEVKGKWGLINPKGEYVVSPQFEMSPSCSFEGMRSVVREGKTGFINSAGQLVVPCRYADAGMFSDGMALVKTDYNTIGYIDKTGREVIKPSRQEDSSDDLSREFHEGLAASTKDGKWGYIDKTGKYVVEPIFSSAQPFAEGLAPVAIPAEKPRP
ncbi:MAG: WG repeat-containing protein [Candidatus Obscuribacterales bacterium]|nr:WG repeat-containing protein [Candidatus Obscuribacterales bacterium]